MVSEFQLNMLKIVDFLTISELPQSGTSDVLRLSNVVIPSVFRSFTKVRVNREGKSNLRLHQVFICAPAHQHIFPVNG